MIKTSTLLFFILLFCGSVEAQSSKSEQPSYRTAIGIRYYPFAVSFKANLPPGKKSFEIIGRFKDGFSGTTLLLWNFQLSQKGNLKLYAGPGAHFGFLNESHGGGAVLGVDGAAGLDYKFLHMPLNISLDWQPSLEFANRNTTRSWGGIGVRFTL